MSAETRAYAVSCALFFTLGACSDVEGLDVQDSCVSCHSDQQQLKATADPVPPPPEPSGDS
jgi:hypothetical protein